ncbi:aldose 1-epimerase family protein [Bailinhaonella thermotolerans]|uniref:Aldose epimerase n=1 Tax=Bailinhaonella thermotolerans TaxID=1070861 RepID=A0A3A4A802_9ACTN|nr:aldose 1-epimerase family protein [Bailinhaonella thermotolerans]RJL24151.1 aldose epimerase [Bailinhaonella thermotolerans]
MAAVTGEQHEIRAGDYRAVVTELGAGLRALWRGDRLLTLAYEEDEFPEGALGQTLCPWPNRVDRGKYAWQGEQRQLDITEPERDCAIHGLVRWHAWTLESRRDDEVVMTHRLLAQPGYPHVLDLRLTYSLDAAEGLTVKLCAKNVGSRQAPFGYGAHPYLHLEAVVDECELTVPGSTRMLTDDRGIPRSTESVEGTDYDLRGGKSLAGLRIDHAFGDLDRDGDGRATVRYTGQEGHSVELWVDGTFPFIEVFTGDTLSPRLCRQGIGIEPMTCPPNAFVSGEELISLGSSQSTTHTWGIR